MRKMSFELWLNRPTFLKFFGPDYYNHIFGAMSRNISDLGGEIVSELRGKSFIRLEAVFSEEDVAVIAECFYEEYQLYMMVFVEDNYIQRK
jgi:hypothetical protein